MIPLNKIAQLCLPWRDEFDEFLCYCPAACFCTVTMGVLCKYPKHVAIAVTNELKCLPRSHFGVRGHDLTIELDAPTNKSLEPHVTIKGSVAIMLIVLRLDDFVENGFGLILIN